MQNEERSDDDPDHDVLPLTLKYSANDRCPRWRRSGAPGRQVGAGRCGRESELISGTSTVQ